jgi:GT2 family glycosyltransferase
MQQDQNAATTDIARREASLPRNNTSVVFCIPGNSFSGKFLECWTELVAWCLKNNIQPILSRRQSNNIYYVRNMCLAADVTRGKDQKPFDSKLDYDFIMWIDSDILFTPAQFQRLLAYDKDIVSGVYAMEGGKLVATVKEWDEETFKKQGYFDFMTVDEVKGKKDLIEVAYTGMGFMLVKKGVFEKLEYPWFKPIEKQIGDMVDFTMEDVAFCLRIQEKGIHVLIDPQIRVGHEKSMVF